MRTLLSYLKFVNGSFAVSCSIETITVKVATKRFSAKLNLNTCSITEVENLLESCTRTKHCNYPF